MLQRMQSWYAEDGELFSLRAGRLARSVYEQISPDLAASIMRIVDAGGTAELEFVLEILERFEGAEEARPIYKAIVGKLPIGDPLLRAVAVGINGTGMVAGEFGLVEAYKVEARGRRAVAWGSQ